MLLSVWTGLNLLVGAAVTVATLIGKPPPALAMTLSPSEIHALDPRVVSVVNAQAALANPCIMAVCAFALLAIWRELVLGSRRAARTLAAVLIPLQAFGFVSDAFVGGHNVVANVASTGLLLAGLALAFTALGAAPSPP